MSRPTLLLAGDVGGTKTALARVAVGPAGALSIERHEAYASDSGGFEEIVARFLADEEPDSFRAAGFGIAGPVIEGRAKTTNLPWELDEEALRDALGVGPVKLLNDLTAMALGMLELAPSECHVLQEGTPRARGGHIGVIAAGTGLGEAMLAWDGTRHVPLDSEGGHGDFAPTSPDEVALYEYLAGDLGEHVSYERVLSGPGLVNLYRFLRETGRVAERAAVAREMEGEDTAQVITRHALADDDALCARALEMFVAIYGAEAGNMALRCVATGGIFVGGGIAPKILPALERGPFLERFRAKGRFRAINETVPVVVSLAPDTPLRGSARYALRHALDA